MTKQQEQDITMLYSAAKQARLTAGEHARLQKALNRLLESLKEEGSKGQDDKSNE